jgi:hypothetical protein
MFRRMCILPPAAFLFCLLPPSLAADSTYECLLSGTGPIQVLDQDYGYTQTRLTTMADGTRFDAREGRWNFSNYGTTTQPYPIIVALKKDICWSGGMIQGTMDENLSWEELDHSASGGNGAAFQFGSGGSMPSDVATPNFILDGIRIHNAWDGIRPSRICPNWTIRNCWVTHNRDDAIENDWYNEGTVDDCLFDGLMVFMSCRGPSYTDADRAKVIVIRNTLVRMQPLPGPIDGKNVAEGHGWFFKFHGLDGPKLLIQNCIFMTAEPSFTTPEIDGVPTPHPDCSNNTFVWLGQGDYPGPFDKSWTVVHDRSVWNTAKQDWINRHPDVARFDFDPPPSATSASAVHTGSRITGLDGPCSIELATPNGRLVYRANLPSRSIEKALQTRPAGVFVARIHSAGGVAIRQVVVSGRVKNP